MVRFALWMLLAASAFAADATVELRDSLGGVHSKAEWAKAPAVVLFFITSDCPVSNSYIPEMNRIREAYAGRGVQFYAVEADPAAKADAVAAHARDYRISFPVLLDPAQRMVRLADATVTPQAVVLSSTGRVLYRGRIDNRIEDFGSRRPEATVRDLRNALDAVLGGQPVAVPFTKSVGCAIARLK